MINNSYLFHYPLLMSQFLSINLSCYTHTVKPRFQSPIIANVLSLNHRGSHFAPYIGTVVYNWKNAGYIFIHNKRSSRQRSSVKMFNKLQSKTTPSRGIIVLFRDRVQMKSALQLYTPCVGNK